MFTVRLKDGDLTEFTDLDDSPPADGILFKNGASLFAYSLLKASLTAVSKVKSCFINSSATTF